MGVSSPNDLHGVEIINSNELELNLTEFMNSQFDGSVDESFFQVPEIESFTDPFLDSVLSQSVNISKDQEINTELNPLPFDVGTTAEDHELNLDNVLTEDNELNLDNVLTEDSELNLDNVLTDELFNFDDIPDIEPDISGDLFSLDAHEGAPFIDNPSNPDSSWVDPQNHVPKDSATLPPLTDGDSDHPAGAWTSDVPSDHHASVQNQPYPETGSCPQGLQGQAMEAGLQQDFSASYQFNSQLFEKNMIDWVIMQPNPHCQSCQLMRRIIHSNGFQDTKLEVHCNGGDNFHAVLQVRLCSIGNAGDQSNSLPQMFQFPRGNSEYMKHFLMQYSLLRAKEGFGVRHDCALVDTKAGAGFSMISDPCFPGPLTYGFPQQTDFNNSQAFGKSALNPWNAMNYAPPRKGPKSSVAAQRERTVQLQLSDCAQYFPLPINEAAKKLSICPTALKKVCRRNGLRRWPYRKIKSIERTIANLEQTIGDYNGQEAESIRSQIEMLKKERAEHCAGYVTQSN